VRRMYHPWHKWECYKAGFYRTTPPKGMSPDDARQMYCEFLEDTPRFESALQRVTSEWRHSCEHFLSNQNINRIAWLGQSSMCIATGIPACFRGGFKLLSEVQRDTANATADKWLWKWAKEQDRPQLCFEFSFPRALRPGTTQERVAEYVRRWRTMGYPEGIPDTVPERLAALGLAPSWQSVALALLKNDLHLTALGFSAPTSKWYSAIKHLEIQRREAA